MTTSKARRKELMKIHGHKYERHFLTEGYYCFYCSDPAQCLDHVPPISIIENYSYEVRKKHKMPTALVPSCLECNAYLSDRSLPTVMDRLLYLESHYEAYFKKQQAMWTEDEINELGTSLRDFIKVKQEKLNRYIDKIRAIQLRMIRTETHPVFRNTED